MGRCKKKYRIANHHILFVLVFVMSSGYGAPVGSNDAAAIADLWYAMELNSGYLKITEQERSMRFAQMENHEVLYMVSKDELLTTYPVDRTVLAYIIKYNPDGYVVVSGDDRIEPIMVCSAESEFRWDQPERNFLRNYLEKVVPALWSHMPGQVHKNWSLLRGKLSEIRDEVTYDDIGRAIYIYWYTPPWDQKGYYNDTCEAHNGGGNVATGCVATALAIKMKYHNWPPNGTSSHAYNDTWGSIQYSHDVDFSDQTYDFASMPGGGVYGPNAEVARIMYHAGVAVDMDYEIAESGAQTDKVADAMNDYFRYRGTSSITGDTSVHIPRIQTSIIGKLPVQIGGWGHSAICDGYRDDISNQYHINAGWSGVGNGWYRLDSLPSGGGTISVSNAYGQPANWVYVNYAWSGAEDGRILQPFNTLAEGKTYLVSGGELMIRSGSYTGTGNVPITFDKAGNKRAYAGDVWIGDNVYIRNYDAIRLFNGGRLKITP